jgi:DNA-binding transcriptional regulator of glucitol operon
VRRKYFSLRAIGLHFALVLWLVLCALAAWWQVGRAIQGNSLSYLYAVEWPVIGVMGILGWWNLLHLDKVSESKELARREHEAKMRAEAQAARAAAPEDPSLAAYNDHLARLASEPKKRLWGH